MPKPKTVLIEEQKIVLSSLFTGLIITGLSIVGLIVLNFLAHSNPAGNPMDKAIAGTIIQIIVFGVMAVGIFECFSSKVTVRRKVKVIKEVE